DAVVERGATGAEVMADARGSLPYSYPRLPHLELKVMGGKHYAYTKDRRRLLAYVRVPGRVRFFMDEAVYADSARVLLPEVAGYGAGLINHLFRAEIHVEISDGVAQLSLAGAQGSVRKGQIRVFAEDASGTRRPAATLPPGSEPARLKVPPGTRKIAAVLRGEDDAGEFVAVGEASVR